MLRCEAVAISFLFSALTLYSQNPESQTDAKGSQPCPDPYTYYGSTEVVTVLSPGLEGNLLGDSSDRPVTVYLPPGYESSPANRYPVIYFLHGYTSLHTSFFGGYSDALDFTLILDRLIDDGVVPPMIIVSPNSNNLFSGSFYTNSVVTGQWDDFIVKDVIQYVEKNYRTLAASESRGIAGHSMGGYGTLKLSMLHPSVFSAAYALSPFGTFLEDYILDIHNGWVTEAACATTPVGMYWESRSYVAMAAAFAPDTDAAPFYGQLPLNCNGEFIDSVWQKWKLHDPYNMLSTYADSLKKLTAIQFDCGTEDDYGFYDPCARFSDTLSQYGITNVFEGYEGTHTSGLPERIETRLLPFFSANLTHEVPAVRLTGNMYLEPSDTLSLVTDLDGTVYVVPENTTAELDSILKYQVVSSSAVANEEVHILLSGLDDGNYVAYAANENNAGISIPVPFSVFLFLPDISIRVIDYISGDPLPDCSMDINGIQFTTDTEGEVGITGGGDCNIYTLRVRHQDYYTLDTVLNVMTDSTIILDLVKDAYLKVLDRATGEPVYRAVISYGGNAAVTNSAGVATLQNQRGEELVFSVNHTEYFLLELPAALLSGDTLVVELTKTMASIEFLVRDAEGPLENLTVQLGGSSRDTDLDGSALFRNRQARNIYTYSIAPPCYYPVEDSLFLEIDTLLHVTLEADTTGPVINVIPAGDSLNVSISADGELYVVPPGTMRQADSITSNPIYSLPLLADVPVPVNISVLPDGEYWIFVIDPCGNVSEEMVLGVGMEELPSVSLKLYPIPVKDQLIVELNDFGNYAIAVKSLNGQVVRTLNFRGTSKRIDLSSYPKGIYFITIRSKDFVATRKIIKL